MLTISVEMPYIGKVLSVNHCCYGGGYRGRLRREVREWMSILTDQVRIRLLPNLCRPPVTVRLAGVFRDRRSIPDLANLHKVVGDAVAKGLGMNDCDLMFEDRGYTLDKAVKPCLRILIQLGERR